MEMGEMMERLGIALGLGLLVGLQRERSGSRLAGFRTFALITLSGAIASLLSIDFGGWVLAAATLALICIIVAGMVRLKEEDPGLTSEIAMLLMFLIGAFVVRGSPPVAAAAGGCIMVLLHLKPQLHSAAKKLGDADLKAIVQFVLITLVILPILPNRAFGPFNVLNPYNIWLMVVLIVGISLGAYIIYKFFGERAGTLAGGVLGGLISSTATTVSYARRAREMPQARTAAILVIMAASAIVFARVLMIIGATAPDFLRFAWMPIGSVFAAAGVMAVILWLRARNESVQMPEQSNPSELKTALTFSALYALVLLGTAAARTYFGERGLLAVSILSGLTDMDAITLSLSRMVHAKQLDPDLAWRFILAAAASNLVFKAGIVAVLGTRSLLLRAGALFGALFAITVGVAIFWPRSAA